MGLPAIIAIAFPGAGLDPKRVVHASIQGGTNEPLLFMLEGTVGDAALEPPRGVEPGNRGRSLARSIRIENVGDTPLEEVAFSFNDWAPGTSYGFQRFARLTPNETVDPLKVFRAWTELRVRGPSPGSRFSTVPLLAIEFFGSTTTADDPVALSSLLESYGVPTRIVPLLGLSVVEASRDNHPVLLDGDREAHFFSLDGKLAGLEDLRRDPLLAIRTKLTGRENRFEIKQNCIEASAFDWSDTSTGAEFRAHKRSPFQAGKDSLWPGEALVLRPDAMLPGSSGVHPYPSSLRSTLLRRFEHEVDAAGRGGPKPVVNLRSSHPVVAVETSPGKLMPLPKQESIVLAALKNDPATPRQVSIAQASHAVMPRLRAGLNAVVVRSKNPGMVRVSVEYVAIREPIHKTIVRTSTHAAFDIETDGLARRAHWQLAYDPSFLEVIPSLDVLSNVTMTSSGNKHRVQIVLSPIERSFFVPGRPLFIRARTELNGLWSEYSNPAQLNYPRPEAPKIVGIQTKDGRTALRVSGTVGDELRLYGSDRIDFVPELYSPIMVTAAIRSKAQTEPNQNLVTSLALNAPEQEVEVPDLPFFRAISFRGGVESVPSPLFATGLGRGTALRSLVRTSTEAYVDAQVIDLAETSH